MALPVAPRQLCAYCGEAAAHKVTYKVFNPLWSGAIGSRAKFQADNPGVTLANWRYCGNGIVVKRDYHTYEGERFLWSVSVWDGETWALNYDPFCTLNCAWRFAEAAYRAGYRMPAVTKDSRTLKQE